MGKSSSLQRTIKEVEKALRKYRTEERICADSCDQGQNNDTSVA